MKRRVICIFMLVFWMITMATFLSIRIEKWMMPTITYIETEPRAEPAEIPADSLFYDDMGIHIYRTRQGQGWEPGLRVWEVSSSDYYVQDGKVQRNAQVRLLRDNVVVFEGKLSSLRHIKEDVKEMKEGYECGMSLEGHNDIKEGDIVECYIMEEIPR